MIFTFFSMAMSANRENQTLDIEGASEPVLYDLVANVTHESVEDKHVYSVQVKDKSRDEWLKIQDLYVESIRREILFLNESYIQVSFFEVIYNSVCVLIWVTV